MKAQKLWNALPESIKSAENLERFKRLIANWGDRNAIAVFVDSWEHEIDVTPSTATPTNNPTIHQAVNMYVTFIVISITYFCSRIRSALYI